MSCPSAARKDEVADYAARAKELARQFLAKGELDRRSGSFEALQKMFYSDILAHYAKEDRTHTAKRERRLRDGIRGRRSSSACRREIRAGRGEFPDR
jgi:hypothetical protein